MPKIPSTTTEYLDELAPDRREMVETVLATIRKNLDKKIEEGVQYKMPSFFVPHSVYPAGYHCDPEIALPFASVAATKGGASIYLFCTYCDESERERLATEWKATGNRLDMGKSCIRVKKLEQVPLDVLGRAVKRMSAAKFVKAYEAGLAGSFGRKKKPAKKSAKKTVKKPVKKTAKKTAKKTVKKTVKKAAKKAAKKTAKRTTRK